MTSPSDLPATLAALTSERLAAKAKYEPLVNRLGSVDFLGLVDAVSDELTARNLELRKSLDAARKPGQLVGNRP